LSELKHKFSYQVLLALTQVFLPLATYPYITRVLGPESLGQVNYVDFNAQLFSMLAAFGIPFYGVREVALRRDRPQEQKRLILELVSLQIFFCLAACLLFILTNLREWHLHPTLYSLGLFNILISTFTFEWYVQGTEQFRFAATRTILIRLLMLAAVFLLVKDTADAPLYLGIFSGGALLIALLNLRNLLQQLPPGNLPLHPTAHLKSLGHFFISSSAIGLYVYFDTILLGKLTHDAALVGQYSTALKLVKMLVLVIMALGAVMSPRIAYLSGKGHTEQISAYHSKMLLLLVTAGLPVCSLLALLAPEIIAVIAGPAFADAVPLLRLLSILPILIGLSNLYCFQTLIPLKRENLLVPAVLAGCAGSLALNLLLIPRYGATGAAVATISTEAVVTLITGYFAHRAVHFKTGFRPIIETVFSTGVVVTGVVCIRLISGSPLLTIAAAGLSGLIVYSWLQYRIFHNVIVREAVDFGRKLLLKQPS